jgi:phenylpropionate dioxygenase-like ring-hydroxylating dioxygenase large terminal subunit
MSGNLERTLPRASYFSDDFFSDEKERIFFREWFCVGRSEEAPSAGDHVAVNIASESVLLVRGKDDALRAFFNVCRHRGSQLVPTADRAAGSFAGAIRCPYHSWTYDLDGKLRTAPFLEDGRDLCKADLPLHSIDIDEWGGFVFVRLNRESGNSSLKDQLGPVPERLARYPLSELRTARRIAYPINANWKVMLENYNECYHCGPVHPELCNLVPAFKHRGGADLDWDRGIPHREGAFTFTLSGTTTRKPFAGLNQDELERHKGELIYPNLMLSLAADHVAAFTVWPHGPSSTTILCDFLFHPSEMSQEGFDPSDAVDFWDLVNRQDWKICESVQRGMSSRVFEYGYYAPMESASLDIRRYIAQRMGDA